MLKVAVHKEDEQGNVYTLLEGFEVIWNGKTLFVPENFKSDGASVPRFFWRAVFPPGDSRALPAAFAHDFVYRTHPAGWTKHMADKMFYTLLKENHINTFRAVLALIGVRLFGKKAWKHEL